MTQHVFLPGDPLIDYVCERIHAYVQILEICRLRMVATGDLHGLQLMRAALEEFTPDDEEAA